MVIRFGPAGASDSFYEGGHKSSLEMPQWLAEKGLTAYEYQCTRGVKIGERMAARLGELCAERDIQLSIHAPYYINLSSGDPDLKVKTKGHLLKSLMAARFMGAKVVVFHPGSGSGPDRGELMAAAKALFKEILAEVEAAGLSDILLAPETMGKRNMLGSLEEVLDLCELGKQVVPAVDFGHMHALSGGEFKDKQSYARVLNRIVERLGQEYAQNLHIHFSPVEFTGAGEKRHRTALETEFGPDFTPLAEILAERNLTPTIICESAGRQAEDVMLYRDIYLQHLAGGLSPFGKNKGGTCPPCLT
ncbi:MAG: TIM barrel protein [Desulfotomaculaceae bacterium]|nr:TIM barrel protein [Desulfotomaculaceae bacterium]